MTETTKSKKTYAYSIWRLDDNDTVIYSTRDDFSDEEAEFAWRHMTTRNAPMYRLMDRKRGLGDTSFMCFMAEVLEDGTPDYDNARMQMVPSDR